MKKNQATAASEYRNAGKYHFRPIGSATQGFNGKVHFYTETFGELSDTQEAQLHLDIEAAFKALNEHAALVECEKTLRCIFANAQMMNAAEPSKVWAAIEKGAAATLAKLSTLRGGK